jgi:hypothetical protein
MISEEEDPITRKRWGLPNDFNAICEALTCAREFWKRHLKIFLQCFGWAAASSFKIQSHYLENLQKSPETHC